MKQIYVKDLKGFMNKEVSDYFFLKKIKEVVKNKPYYDLVLTDKTGEVKGKVWSENINPQYLEFNEAIVFVTAQVTEYNGAETFTVKKIQPTKKANVEFSDFFPCYQDIEGMFEQIMAFIERIKKPHLRAVLDQFLCNQKIVEAFKRCQGGTKIHHCLEGGLVAHTLEVLKCATAYIPIYRNLTPFNYVIDEEILITACILHDFGKIKEYVPYPVNKRSVCGIMQGHLYLSHSMVYGVIYDLKKQGINFPKEDEVKLLHCILSSHGEFSDIKPSCKEAAILAIADKMSSMVNAIDTAIEADRADDEFTPYNPYLETYIFKY